jgi:gamma-glutamylcysteine synthetase
MRSRKMKRKLRSSRLTQEEKPVDRLIVTFNSMDKHLRALNKAKKSVPFPESPHNSKTAAEPAA